MTGAGLYSGPRAATPEPLRHAAALLVGRTAQFAERVLPRLRGEVPYYANSLTVPSDVLTSVYRGLEIAVRSFADPERVTDSGEYAWRLGRKRALEGTPLLPLAQAYRVGIGVLWEGMVAAASADDPESGSRLVHCATDYWRHCDRDMALMVAAFRSVEGAVIGDDARRFVPMLRVLLRGGAGASEVAAAAVALDLPLEGRYVVVRCTADMPPDLPVREEIDEAVIYRAPHRHGGMTLVALLADRSESELAQLVAAAHPGARAGMSPVVGALSELARGRELAELVLGTATGAEVVALSEVSTEVLLLARPDLAAEHTAATLGPVLALDTGERALLLDTFGAWLDCNGSVTEAGKRVFCHPNTVLNRLRRLERLTGRDLDRPRDLVALTLAVQALRLVPGAGQA